MKKTLFAIITLIISANLWAGPFVSINSVNAKRSGGDVNVEVSVIGADNGEINGLDEGNLLVYEDGYRVNYVKVRAASDLNDGLCLVFALDSSKSISRRLLAGIKKNARSILQGLSRTDRAAVYRFNGDIKLLNNFTSDKEEISRSVRSIQRVGSKTRLYDAIYDSISLLDRLRSRRRAVIVFTDGTDDGSSIKADDVIAESKEKKIPVYFVSYGARGSKISRIAKLTGGRVFNVNSRNCENIYAIIVSSIKSVYHISYKSQASIKSGDHTLEVRLSHGNLKDRDSMKFQFKGLVPDFSLPKDIPGLKIFAAVFAALLFVFLMAYLSRLFRKKQKDEEKSQPLVEPEYEPVYVDDSYIDSGMDFDEDYPREYPDVMYSEAWLQRRGGECLSKKIPLLKRDAVIGYDRDNQVSVDDEYASMHHARIRRIEGGYYLYDLISDRGTYLNGKKLLRPRLLHDWDEIKVGNTLFIFRGVR